MSDLTKPTLSITEPLRLAVGSHAAGSGKGCAMNLISWESGDTTITDLPACADEVLARIVQHVNDRLCTHRDGDLLCPACSIVVLGLAHRTVGTGQIPITDLQRHVIWVKVAIDQARQVENLVPDRYKDRAQRAITAAENWIKNPSPETRQACRDAAAANAATYAYAAANAAYAAADAAANAAANAANAAAYAAANAADAAYGYAANAAAGGRELVRLATRAIDIFEELTSHVAPVIPEHEVERAYTCMTAATPEGTSDE